MDDDRLLLVLASLREDLDVPSFDLAAPTAGPQRWWVIPAAAAVLVLVAVLAVEPSREALADWFGLGSTSVVRTDGAVAVGSGRLDDDSPEVVAEPEVALTAEHPLLRGSPEILEPPEGGTIYRWSDGEITLWARRVGVSTTKIVLPGEVIESLPEVGGGEGLWIAVDHTLVTSERIVGADRVLLWVLGDVELRLEADISQNDAVAIARSVRVVGTGTP